MGSLSRFSGRPVTGIRAEETTRSVAVAGAGILESHPCNVRKGGPPANSSWSDVAAFFHRRPDPAPPMEIKRAAMPILPSGTPRV